MAKWLGAQEENYPQVVSQSNLARLQTAQVRTPGELRLTQHLRRVTDVHFGLSWRIYRFAGHKVVNRAGWLRAMQRRSLFYQRRTSA
jgi:hypothetical protein